jgi:hypothetical protein
MFSYLISSCRCREGSASFASETYVCLACALAFGAAAVTLGKWLAGEEPRLAIPC